MDLNQEETNKYILEWRDYVLNASEAMKDGDDEQYAICMEKANEAYEKYKEDSKLAYECKNFGLANHVFESALPQLFKKNQKVVKEVMKLIKEDKNLLSQFMFYKSLDSYNKNLDSKEYLSEALQLASKNIDFKTVKASNRKLGNIIKENKIKAVEAISEDKLKLYEECDYLLTHKKGLLNLSTYNDNVNKVSDYVVNNINESSDKGNKANTLENFNKKYSNILTKEEKSFVRQIVESKQSGNVAKQESLFNHLKNECIKTIDKLMETATESDKEGLQSIREQLENQKFLEETLVKDIAKFIEIKDVLNS